MEKVLFFEVGKLLKAFLASIKGIT